MQREQTKSALQKNFQTQSTFKRNSRYYDAPNITNLQNQYSIKRRQPIASPRNQSHKLQSSFTNSTTALSTKLNEDIDKYRYRVSLSGQKSDYEREYSSPSSPKLKSFSIEKMSSRNYHHDRKNKAIQDERLFNNFKIEKADLSKTSDFSKLKGKSLDFKLHHLNDIYHESQKPYQHFFYKTTTCKSKVNYKLENKQQKRYFFRSKRKEDYAATVLNPQKVDSGLKIASNFKGSNITDDKISPFHLQSGRQMPSQYDMRYMTNLTHFRRGSDGKIIRPRLDYTVVKMKQQLINQRQQKIRKSKKPQFERNQVCDEKYFKAKFNS